MMTVVVSLRRYAGSIGRYSLGLLAIVWLVSEMEITRMGTIVGKLSPKTVTALIAVTGIGLIARFYMWHVLVTHYRQTGFTASANTDLAINFINQLLPSRLSGRAAAPIILHNQFGLGYPEAVAISGVHTGLFAILYGLGSLLGLLFLVLGTQLPMALLGLLVLSTGLYLLAGIVVLIAGIHMRSMNRVVDLLDALVCRLPGTAVSSRLSVFIHKVPRFTADSANAFRTLSMSWAVIGGYAIGWIGALLIGPSVRVWILLSALGTGTGIDPVLFPFYLVAAYSVTLLPLTPGGIGVTEMAATAVFIALGVPNEIIVPVIFIDRVLGVYLPALVGWYPSMQLDSLHHSSE